MNNYYNFDWQENNGYENIKKANLKIKPLKIKIIEYRKDKKSNIINTSCACNASLKLAACGI